PPAGNRLGPRDGEANRRIAARPRRRLLGSAEGRHLLGRAAARIRSGARLTLSDGARRPLPGEVASPPSLAPHSAESKVELPLYGRNASGPHSGARPHA